MYLYGTYVTDDHVEDDFKFAKREPWVDPWVGDAQSIFC